MISGSGASELQGLSAFGLVCVVFSWPLALVLVRGWFVCLFACLCSVCVVSSIVKEYFASGVDGPQTEL